MAKGMKHQGRIESGEHAGMHAYHGTTWGEKHDAVYDLEQVRQVGPFEKAATDFEDKLGAWAFQEAQPYAERLSEKVVDYLTIKYQDIGAMAATLDQKLEGLKAQLPGLGIESPGWAGAVGTDFESIKGVLTSGNLRERLIVVEQYAKKVLSNDVVHDQDGLAEIIAKAEQAGLDLEASLIQGDFGEWTTPWETGDHNRDQTVVATGDTFRAKGADLESQPIPEDQQAAVKPANTPLPADFGQPGSSVGQFEGNYQVKQGAVAGSEKSEDAMKWVDPMAAMIMNEANAWVKKQREVGMPLKGGPSGHTHKFMTVNQILGMPNTPDEMRLACIGHLLPIKAHTFIEVMEGAKALGASPYPNSQLVYRNLAPYGESLAGLVGAPFPDTVLDEKELAQAGLIEAEPLNMDLVPKSQQDQVQEDSAASMKRMDGEDTDSDVVNK